MQKNPLKRFYTYLNSHKSDFILSVCILVLLNIAASMYFFRVDLTTAKTYSLSEISRQTLRTIADPLQVELFFTSDLPAPYNTVERYMRDLMEEYKNAANENFSFRFHDMSNNASRDIASSYNIHPLQVQQIQSDEFQSRNVYMGLALVYGDMIESIPQIGTTEGLEYVLTSSIQKMLDRVDSLAGLTDSVELTLYASDTLQQFNITGFDQLDEQVQQAFQAVNKKNYKRLVYRRESPETIEAEKLSRDYGLNVLRWEDSQRTDGTTLRAGAGTMDIVLSYGDAFRRVPLELQHGMFGGYAVAGLDDLEARISAALDVLLSKNPSIGYLTGHGELSLYDEQLGAAAFYELNSDLYSIVEVPAHADNDDFQTLGAFQIPEDIQTLVINGPKTRIRDDVLYAIDQFLLRGGSLVVFYDSFEELQSQEAMMSQQAPMFQPTNSGLHEFLSYYGIRPEKNYVLDMRSYVHREPQYGNINLYYIPIVERQFVDQRQLATKGLEKLTFLQTSSISIDRGFFEETENLDVHTLVTSSTDAWLMEGAIDLNPFTMQPPLAEERRSFPLVVLAEGRFPSAFASAPVAERARDDLVATGGHLESALADGRIILVGSSALTTAQLIDPQGKSPNAILIHNLIDYANGNLGMIPMRTKGLTLNTLNETRAETRFFVKTFNMVFVPVFIVFIGLFAWRLRIKRKRYLHEVFAKGVDHE